MSNITKTPIQRTITVSLDASNQVTHAWQQTVYSIAENGVELHRPTGDKEDLDPAAIAAAMPAQAALLSQIEALKVASATALQKAADEAATQLKALQDRLDVANARLATVTGHINEAVKAAV